MCVPADGCRVPYDTDVRIIIGYGDQVVHLGLTIYPHIFEPVIKTTTKDARSLSDVSKPQLRSTLAKLSLKTRERKGDPFLRIILFSRGQADENFENCFLEIIRRHSTNCQKIVAGWKFESRYAPGGFSLKEFAARHCCHAEEINIKLSLGGINGLSHFEQQLPL